MQVHGLARAKATNARVQQYAEELNQLLPAEAVAVVRQHIAVVHNFPDRASGICVPMVSIMASAEESAVMLWQEVAALEGRLEAQELSLIHI